MVRGPPFELTNAAPVGAKVIFAESLLEIMRSRGLTKSEYTSFIVADRLEAAAIPPDTFVVGTPFPDKSAELGFEAKKEVKKTPYSAKNVLPDKDPIAEFAVGETTSLSSDGL
jgi:hypothetical protein